MATVSELVELVQSKADIPEDEALEIIHTIASSDYLYRTPLALLNNKDRNALRMRDEAELIIDTLLAVREAAEFKQIMATACLIASRRVFAGEQFFRVLASPNIGA